jgi:hypothetical protein
MFKDDITGQPILVSNKTNQVLVRALVSAHRAGDITDTEYCMAYAEAVELGRYPQAFGGGTMNPERMERWQSLKSWANTPDNL